MISKYKEAKKVKHISTKTKCSIALALTIHFLLLILISPTTLATSTQNSSIIGPDGYQNSSIIGPDGYQNSSIIGPDGYQNSSITGSYAYITSSDTDTVAIIDTLTDNVTNIVDTETFTNTDIRNGGDSPYGVAVTPDGTEVYVTNTNSGTVSVIDTVTNSVVAIVDVKGYARGIAVNPTGTKVYVASDFMDYDSERATHGIVSEIDTATKTVTATIKVGVNPYGVAVSPNGTEIYVVNRDSSTISIVDTTTKKFKATIPVGDGDYYYPYNNEGPTGVAIAPDGKKLYVTSYVYGNAAVFVINTTTETITETIKVGTEPNGIAVNPDGTKVYVANSGSSTVSVIDTSTNNVTATVNVGKGPYGIAVTPDGMKVYTTNYRDNTVSVIDTSTNTVINTVNAGSRPYSFGQFIGPAPANWILPVANFSNNVTEGYVPFCVQFRDLSENATSVSWDFENDGVINSTDRNPIHEYTVPGNYTVNLTAINENGTNSAFATINALDKPVPVSHWEFHPEEPVSGDILYINGSAFPGNKADVFATFEKTVPVSMGRYEYSLEDIVIPEGSNNSYKVEAQGAKNLNVRVKMILWVTKSSKASGNTATVSQSNVPPGNYKMRIDGNAGEGVSEVNLKVTASQETKIDSNGNFNYSYNTTAIPPGIFKIKIGNITKEITIKPEKIEQSAPVLQ